MWARWKRRTRRDCELIKGNKRTWERENASQIRNASWDSCAVWVEEETWRGGEAKGAILTQIQNRSCFPFIHALFPLFALLSLSDYDGHVIGWASYPSFCWCKNCVIRRPRGVLLCVCVCVYMRVWEREIERERGWGWGLSVEGHQSLAGVKEK